MAGDAVFVLNKKNEFIRHDGCNGAPPAPQNTIKLNGLTYSDALTDAIKKGFPNAQLSSACNGNENPPGVKANKPTPAATPTRTPTSQPPAVAKELKPYQDLLMASDESRISSRTVGHPGLHTPLRGEGEKTMQSNILAEYHKPEKREAQTTTYFLRLSDSLEALRAILKQNQGAIGDHQSPGQRIEIAPPRPGKPPNNTNTALPKNVEIGVYSLQGKGNKFRHGIADKATLILDCPGSEENGCNGIEHGLKVVTFYPRER